MSKNAVGSVRAVQFDSPAGRVGVITVDLDITDLAMADALVRKAVDRLKLQRLSSGLPTHTLLVMMTGDLTAESFARRWRRLALEDGTLGLMMSEMRRAEVIQAKATERASIFASLFPQPAPEFLDLAMPAQSPSHLPLQQTGAASTVAAAVARAMPA